MTTSRTRRNKTQQAQDVLRALLKDQGHKAKRLKEMYEEAEADAAKTRRALESLGTEMMLPGFKSAEESERISAPVQPIGDGGTGDDLTVPQNTWVDPTDLQPVPMPVTVRPHHQRIGEKSISDVWEEGVVNVHTALMYSRQRVCEWCLRGVPYATEQRVEHYVETEAGVIYEVCKGVEA